MNENTSSVLANHELIATSPHQPHTLSTSKRPPLLFPSVPTNNHQGMYSSGKTPCQLLNSDKKHTSRPMQKSQSVQVVYNVEIGTKALLSSAEEGKGNASSIPAVSNTFCMFPTLSPFCVYLSRRAMASYSSSCTLPHLSKHPPASPSHRPPSSHPSIKLSTIQHSHSSTITRGCSPTVRRPSVSHPSR